MSSFRRLSKFAMSAAVGLVLVAVMALPAAGADEPYGVKTFSNHTTAVGGAPYTDAGGHPDLNVTEFTIPFKGSEEGGGAVETVEDLNGTYVNPPLGFIGNPAVAPRCPLSKLPVQHQGPDTCLPAPDSQLGLVEARLLLAQCAPCALYNVPPERGYPAQFGFMVNTTLTLLSVFLQPRTESYGLTIGTPNVPSFSVRRFRSTFFGIPSQHGSGTTDAPFLSNPVDCSVGDPTWRIALDSSQNPGALLGLGIPDLSDPDWKTASELAPAVTGCDDPALAEQFALTKIAAKPLQGPGPIQADAPTGLAVELEFPQSNDPTDPDTEFHPEVPQAPAPKDITVKLPAGLSISPSSADGLGACSDQASDSAGDQVHYDNTKPVSCPDSAKIGSAVATSPLLATHDPQTDAVNGAEPIPGDVYLLKPHPGDLPIGGGNQDGKFRLLIQLENPRYGINLKLPGVAIADRNTGQLTTVFTDNPQLPAKQLTVNLKTGPRAPLASPVTCGNFQTTTNFVPWSTPGTPNANPSADFSVGSGPNGSGCVNSPGQRPFAPALVTAGPASAIAGAHSPFTLKLTRNDGEQEFSSLDMTLPKGLAAKFVGIPYCSDAALAAAAARSGKAELASPSCPASRIGKVTVGAGPGSNPFYTTGQAYLAGPYKGAPMSVAAITPAVAGPFDLGTVVVRNALYVDPETAQGRVVSDPFPKIIDGVPLKLRDITVTLDRPGFTLNPTSCEAKSINVKLTSTDGAVANPTNHFQVGGCKNLGFKPKLAIDLKGSPKRNKNPILKATLTYPAGAYANIAKAQVTLPHSEFLDQSHIKTICTRVQFAANACPAASIYGKATAITPLLDQPLSGPVYLRSSSNPLPDLVADLNGQIHVALVGRIDSVNGGIRNTFEAVPDAPVSKFVLEMQGGKKGLLVNSRNLCKSVNKADVKFTGQNGLQANSKPVVTNDCKGKAKKGKGKKGAKGKRVARAWVSTLSGLTGWLG